MNIASLLTSLNDAKRILKEADILKDYNKTRKPSLDISKFSEDSFTISLSDDYDYIYKSAMKNMDYDFLLTDDSFFQFSCILREGSLEKGEIRYAFYENPRDYGTYEEFLEENGFTYDECQDEFLMDFEQGILEAKLKKNVTPIRYDYNHKLYKPVNHSISHIHIGHNNEVRVTTSKILTPAKFVSFVLRNVYPDTWNTAFKNEGFREMCLSARRACQPINSDYFNEYEKSLLHIT